MAQCRAGVSDTRRGREKWAVLISRQAGSCRNNENVQSVEKVRYTFLRCFAALNLVGTWLEPGGT
jgi:hypothetical protein